MPSRTDPRLPRVSRRPPMSLPLACLSLATLLLLAHPAAARGAPKAPAPDTLGRFEVTVEQLEKVKSGFAWQTVHVSPDGRHVAALATRGGRNGYVRFDSPDGARTLDRGAYLWIQDAGATREWHAVVWAGWSPDSRRLAYVTVQDQEMWVTIDGKQLGPYEFLPEGDVVFSDDGEHFAFVVAESAGDDSWRLRVVVDGVPSEPFDMVTGPEGGPFFTFAPRGGHWLMFCRRGQTRHAVVDGRFGPPFDQNAGAPAFSPDGEHFAYVGIRGDGFYLVHDDSLGGPWTRASDPVFSPVSDDLAYCVQEGEQGYVMVNHRPLRRYRSVHEPRFSPDGRRLAYLAFAEDGRSFVVVDSTAGPPQISAASPRFQENGQLFYDVYLDSTGTRRAIYLEDRRLPEMTGTFADLHDEWNDRDLAGLWLSASPDRGHVAYGWREDEKTFHVVVDGQEYGRLVSADSFTWTPDGRRWAFRGLVEADKMSAFVDGGQGPPYHDAGATIFSPDGRSFAYLARHNEDRMMVVDHQEGRRWERIWPQWAAWQPTGELVYYAREGRYLHRVVLAPRR